MHIVTNSIIKNEKKEYADSIEFYLTYFGAQKEGVNVLKKMEMLFPNNKFYLRHVPSELPNLFKKYEALYDFESSAKHIQTSSVLARFDLDQIWPEITDRLLYLDLDLIVKGSVTELFNLADENKTISACKSGSVLASELRSWERWSGEPAQVKYFDYLSQFRDNFKAVYEDHLACRSINTNVFDELYNKKYDLLSPALNAGVFILNVEKYKKNKRLKNNINFLIELNSRGDFLKYNDQSILNFGFYGQVDWIDQEWNRMDYGWENIIEAERVQADFADAKIVHYNGWRKPWSFWKVPENEIPEYFLPSVKLWREYKV
jgi:lipopolysaccharide biosynthesis glycosyltransferase